MQEARKLVEIGVEVVRSPPPVAYSTQSCLCVVLVALSEGPARHLLGQGFQKKGGASASLESLLAQQRRVEAPVDE